MWPLQPWVVGQFYNTRHTFPPVEWTVCLIRQCWSPQRKGIPVAPLWGSFWPSHCDPRLCSWVGLLMASLGGVYSIPGSSSKPRAPSLHVRGVFINRVLPYLLPSVKQQGPLTTAGIVLRVS